LDWTILRPGRLTDDPGVGKVLLAPSVPRGAVTRDDVAAVLAALLDSPGTIGQTLELVEGDDDVLAAVAAIALPPSRDQEDDEPDIAPQDTAAAGPARRGRVNDVTREIDVVVIGAGAVG